MRVQIRYVADPGDLSRERLVMQVHRGVDIGSFMLVRTGFEDDGVDTSANEINAVHDGAIANAYWFPDKRLQAGDLVVVYSKAGGDREKPLDDGHKAHFFYWGQKSPLWDDEEFTPVLLYAPQWAAKTPQELRRTAATP